MFFCNYWQAPGKGQLFLVMMRPAASKALLRVRMKQIWYPILKRCLWCVLMVVVILENRVQPTGDARFRIYIELLIHVMLLPKVLSLSTWTNNMEEISSNFFPTRMVYYSQLTNASQRSRVSSDITFCPLTSPPVCFNDSSATTAGWHSWSSHFSGYVTYYSIGFYN